MSLPGHAEHQHACECGAALILSPGVDDEVTRLERLHVVMNWEWLHTGPGHGPCTFDEARSIRTNERKRRERAALRRS